LIFWNHPFNKGTDSNEQMLLRAGFDYQYQSLQRYFEGAHSHLAKNSRLLLGTGNIASLEEIKDMASFSGYSFDLLARMDCPMGPNSPNTNDFRIYELRR